jgi:hypothetical protein
MSILPPLCFIRRNGLWNKVLFVKKTSFQRYFPRQLASYTKLSIKYPCKLFCRKEFSTSFFYFSIVEKYNPYDGSARVFALLKQNINPFIIPIFGIQIRITHKLRSYAYKSESNNKVPLDSSFFIRWKINPVKQCSYD